MSHPPGQLSRSYLDIIEHLDSTTDTVRYAQYPPSCQEVSRGEDGVFGRVRNVGIRNSSATSPHVVRVKKNIKLFLPPCEVAVFHQSKLGFLDPQRLGGRVFSCTWHRRNCQCITTLDSLLKNVQNLTTYAVTPKNRWTELYLLQSMIWLKLGLSSVTNRL